MGTSSRLSTDPLNSAASGGASSSLKAPSGHTPETGDAKAAHHTTAHAGSSDLDHFGLMPTVWAPIAAVGLTSVKWQAPWLDLPQTAARRQPYDGLRKL